MPDNNLNYTECHHYKDNHTLQIKLKKNQLSALDIKHLPTYVL